MAEQFWSPVLSGEATAKTTTTAKHRWKPLFSRSLPRVFVLAKEEFCSTELDTSYSSAEPFYSQPGSKTNTSCLQDLTLIHTNNLHVPHLLFLLHLQLWIHKEPGGRFRQAEQTGRGHGWERAAFWEVWLFNEMDPTWQAAEPGSKAWTARANSLRALL